MMTAVREDHEVHHKRCRNKGRAQEVQGAATSGARPGRGNAPSWRKASQGPPFCPRPLLRGASCSAGLPLHLHCTTTTPQLDAFRAPAPPRRRPQWLPLAPGLPLHRTRGQQGRGGGQIVPNGIQSRHYGPTRGAPTAPPPPSSVRGEREARISNIAGLLSPGGASCLVSVPEVEEVTSAVWAMKTRYGKRMV